MNIEIYGDGHGMVELIDYMGEDITVVNAARVSFGKNKKNMDEKDEKLIKYLIKHRHTSTLEHNVVTFRFTVPLFVRSQHHRHRTWSYNEISRRYTDENLRFYEPEYFRTQHKSNRQASCSDILIDPVIYPDLSDPDYGSVASEVIKNHHKHSVELYNISGQKVRTLVNKQYQAGRHMVQWSATNDFGQSVASGMYLYRIQAGSFVSHKKLVLMK